MANSQQKVDKKTKHRMLTVRGLLGFINATNHAECTIISVGWSLHYYESRWYEMKLKDGKHEVYRINMLIEYLTCEPQSDDSNHLGRSLRVQ